MKNPSPSSPLGEIIDATIDIMRGREEGLKRIDVSETGLFNSFYGLTIMVLIDLTVLMLVHQNRTSGLSDKPDQFSAVPGLYAFAIGMILIQLVAYAASVLVIYLLARPKERAGIVPLVTVSNWAAPLISLVVSPLILITMWTLETGESRDISVLDFVGIAVFAALIIVGTRLIRICLSTDAMRAFMLYALSALAAFVLAEGFETLFGLSLPT